MTQAFIGIGSNRSDPSLQLDRALQNLGRIPNSQLIDCSPRYWTAPWGDTDQPDFLNAVAQLKTSLEALALLHALHAIEELQGRQRDPDRPWGPRPLDLDLLLFGEQVIDTPNLHVPHPRMTERAFVLIPLLELAPDIEIPGRGPASEYIKTLETGELRPANEPTKQ